MKDSWEVIVVGAGPAGATAARFAAEGGARTLLLEKHPVIGYPLCCAEAISTSGLKRVVEPDPRWINCKIERVHLYGPNGSHAEIYHPEAGFMLERKIFDRALAEKAAEAGAEIRVAHDVIGLIEENDHFAGVIARSHGHERKLTGKVIIAADGIESQVAFMAGLKAALKPSQIHSAYQYLISSPEIAPETLEFHLGTRIAPGGYIWLFAKRESLANVGIGVCPTKTPKKKAMQLLDEFVRRRFGRFAIIERMTGGVPTYLPDLPLYKGNILLAGDAARVVDSLSGAGIANALLSGMLAGQTASAMAKGQGDGDDYQKAFCRIKEKELNFYRRCRQLFLKLNDKDMETILRFADDMFSGRTIEGINPVEIVKKILLSYPRLMTLGRHLLF